MKTNSIIVLCDNPWIEQEIKKIFDLRKLQVLIESSDLYEDLSVLIGKYDLIISAHCKKLFPKKILESCRIINIHPGLNPYNRGMYPHVFSIINGLPAGATIHEIDEKIDNGDIIAQQEVGVLKSDDSKSLHERIMRAEINLFDKHFDEIIYGTYKKTKPFFIGNINYKSDFEKLKKINLLDIDSFENHINLLRSMTYGDYKNAYFIDEKGNKVYVKIELSTQND